MSNAPLIEARNISKYYEDGKIIALDTVSFSVSKGEFLIITGPSGSGKSTILHLLGGLDTPTEGEILFESRPIKEVLRRPLFRIENIGFVFQAYYLWPTLNVYENVSLPLMEADLDKREKRRRVECLTAVVGLADKLSLSVNKLSFGERQRVAIARALIMNPKVLLADEPTGNLDIRNRDNIFALFKRINDDSELTIIMATHDQRSFCYGNRILHLSDGKLCESSGKE